MGKFSLTLRQRLSVKFGICLLAISLYLIPSWAQAERTEIPEKNQEIVQAFVAEGLDAYARGNLKKAIENFSRALLIEPHQETARKNLLLISHHQNLSAPQKVQLFLLEDLLSFTQNLQDKTVYFETKCASLREALRQRGHEETFQAPYFPAEEGSVPDENVSDPLEALNAALSSERERLFREISSLEKEHEWLRRLSREKPPVFSGRKITFETKQAVESPIAVDSISAENPPADTASGTQGEIVALREELRLLREQLSDLKKHVEEKDRKTAGLTKQVVEFSLQLAEKEVSLSEQIDVLSSLSLEYKDLQSRLELSQEIISGKDAQIQSLRENLALSQEAFMQKDGEIADLEGILRIYSEKLSDTRHQTREKVKQMAAMGEELSSVRTQLFSREIALERTRQKLAFLEKEFSDIQKYLLESQEKPDSGNQKKHDILKRILELRSRMEDVRAQEILSRF